MLKDSIIPSHITLIPITSNQAHSSNIQSDNIFSQNDHTSKIHSPSHLIFYVNNNHIFIQDCFYLNRFMVDIDYDRYDNDF